MIEILNVEPINKGYMLAKCDVHIKPWKMTLKEVIIFQKGVQKWITLPSRSYTTPEGQVKYTELVSFDNEAIKGRFRDQIMKQIESYLITNPELKTEDVIKDEELPF